MIRHLSIFLLAIAFAALAEAGFQQASGSLTAGCTLEAGKVYVVTSDLNLKASGRTPAIALAANATNVIYVAKGAILSVTGGAGSGTEPGCAGIRVPYGSLLILTGEGGIIATGGNAGNGSNGGGGEWGYYYKNGGVEQMITGNGGNGGAGGGGAGAGIGTDGGYGGTGGAGGGTGGAAGDRVYSDFHNGVYDKNGQSGLGGNSGTAAAYCGQVRVCGSLTVMVDSGAAGSWGSGGGAGWSGNDDGSGSAFDNTAGGGGGGGGGGAGSAAYWGGGVGGGGGAGGGGGGGGATLWKAQASDWYYVGGRGGAGGKSGVGGDAPATANGGNCDNGNYDGGFPYGGGGGASGWGGGSGAVTNFLCQSTASVVPKTSWAGSVTVPMKNETYSELAYRIDFDKQTLMEKAPASIDVQLGCAYAKCEYVEVVDSITRVLDVYCMGWYTKPDGKGEQYFNAMGEPTKSAYTERGNVTLYPYVVMAGGTGVYINGVEVDGGTESGRAGAGWNYSKGVLTLDGTAPSVPTISGTNTTRQLEIRLTGVANVKFENLYLQMSAGDRKGIIQVVGSTNVTITLNGDENVLDASTATNTAAIYCPYGSSLTLKTAAANSPYALEQSAASNVVRFAGSTKVVLQAKGGPGAAAIGGAGGTCGDIEIGGVAMALDSGGPYLVGNGLVTVGASPNRAGRIVFDSTLVRPLSWPAAEPVWPRPHDLTGRPMFKANKNGGLNYFLFKDFIYLPTGYWVSSSGASYRVSFNAVQRK